MYLPQEAQDQHEPMVHWLAAFSADQPQEIIDFQEEILVTKK